MYIIVMRRQIIKLCVCVVIKEELKIESDKDILNRVIGKGSMSIFE